MRRIFCLCCFIATLSPVIAQKELPDFGKIDPADLRLKSCSFEPSASAMKLFDVQEIDFDANSYTTKLTTERRVRIKIFNEKGYRYASIKIPYFSKKRSTRIKDLKGIIYSLDSTGKVVTQKLDEEDFFKDKMTENIGVVNFTFPNLKPGSVVEFSYKKTVKNVIQIDPWLVQSDIPTLYTSTIFKYPTFSRVTEKVVGADTIEEKMEPARNQYGLNKKTYYRENVASFQSEPFMSSRTDNLIRVVFILLPVTHSFADVFTQPETLWSLAGNALLRSPHFGGQIKALIPGTEKMIDSALLINPMIERVRFIYEAVKKHMPDKTEQTMYPGDILEAWNNKTGNTAEINMILLNLLRKAQVQCYPLLVSTRENGLVDMKFPSIGQMNGVDVLAVDSNSIYIMDASLRFLSPLTPPFNILNRQCFLLEEANMQWVKVVDQRALLKQNIAINAELKNDGTIDGQAYCLYYDYAKSFMLDSTIDEDGEDKFYDRTPEGLTIHSTKQEDADDDSKALLQNLGFTYTPQQTGDFYFINPLLVSLKKENPFIKETRKTDMDLGSNQKLSFSLRLAIPAEFSIESLPKKIIVRAPDSSFFFKRTVESDSSGIYLSQTFDINQSTFSRDEYPTLREFFEQAYALMGEEIVLKRKKK